MKDVARDNKGKGFLRLSGLVDFVISVLLLLTTVVALLVGLYYLNVSESLTATLEGSTVYFGMLTNIVEDLAGDAAGTVSMIVFGVFLVVTIVSFLIMTRDFAIANLDWDEAKKKNWIVLVLSLLQLALVGVAVWQIVILVQNESFPSDITFYIVVALTATWLVAALTKFIAFIKIKNFEVNEAMASVPAYPYGGNPRGSNIAGSTRGFVYTPNSEPPADEEELSKRELKNAAFDSEKQKLDTLLSTGVITKDEYNKRLRDLK